ncbi:phage portal protein [Streptomyces klenkii]|uniref:Phage portal protein n=1 Tax=Streptomyces klenkii TaxID=1420899 RepID=A0A3B0AMF8_9ACTN|nr:phage portal protein [Streptomyces klenkii]RKN61869.1 phage portal protein [Streptomyces klenkii]
MRSPLRALAALRNKAPLPYVGRAYSGPFLSMAGRRDAEAQMRAMGSVGTLFAIVNRTSTSTALVEWKLWRKAASGQDEDRVEVTRHAALDLWRKPNPFMPRMEFVETFQQHLDLTGEAWWVISRSGRASVPLELWPVRPDRMEPVPDRENFLSGYLYLGPDGERVPLRLDEVIHIRMPNPLDVYRGMGPVQALQPDLDAVRYSAEWNRNFFLNSAEPGGIIEVPNGLSDTEFDELRDRWNEQHRGVAAAHRVAILEHGKWVDRKFTQRDMQFAELRGIARDVIREAFGMPSPMLGVIEDANRANMEAAEVIYSRYLTTPRLERIKQALNHELLPLYGRTAEGLEWDYVNPVPEDRELAANELAARARAVKELVDAGVHGPEALDAVGLPEMAFGQPGADPDRALLIELVKGAPADLARLLLPLLGFELPQEPEEGGAPAPPPQARGTPFEEATARLLAGVPEVDDAQRWVVVAQDDDDTCEPCRDNDGRTYRNRRQAYRDYPGGSGYIHCEGAKYGNDCRCKVVKRGRRGGDNEEGTDGVD